MKEETRLQRALEAAQYVTEMFLDLCHMNEAEFSGWGDMIVPEGATKATKKAKEALAILESINFNSKE